MTISGALAGAVTGLSAAARAADLVAENIANARTEGYARREIQLSSKVAGGHGLGVATETTTAKDPRSTADRRGADAALAAGDVAADAAARLSRAFGTPGEAGSLATRTEAFESALRTLADTPESGALQGRLLSTAQDLATKIGDIGQAVAEARTEADAAIGRGVAEVNATLHAIDALNGTIQARTAQGVATATFEDQRNALLDRLNTQIPVRTVRGDNGLIAIYSLGGDTLLDREVFELGFTATPVITQDMTLASGALSGLTLGGRAVEIGTGAGRLEGGALAAQFALRDVTGPAAGEAIDAFAAEIIGRFEAAGLDPTLTPGDPGLFTDAGAALDPLATEGLATRIAVNPTVDPAAGGELWRLRDGLGATVEGTAGDASLLNALLAAATTPSAPPTATGVSGAHGLADLAGALTGLAVQSASETDESAAYLLGQAASFRDAELASVGVDTDSELQKLLVIERTYAANARVIETLDGLLARLLEI